MNILLVYPTYPDTFWSFKHALRFVDKKAAFPPLGLLTVAAMLPENWNKKLVDMNITELQDDQLDWADMVFVSAMLVQRFSAQEVINRAKARGKTVVAGGPAFTSQPELFEGVDHLVLNEAELTLPLFLNDLAQGNPKSIYTTTEKPTLENTPVPMWSLIRMNDYVAIPVQYSRGCPFNCEFCDIIVMYGKTPRTKSAEQMIRELQSLYDAGWRSGVFIVDDNFIGNKVKVKKMLPELIEWQKNHRYPFHFLTEASVNLADDKELMDMMTDANFQKIFLGIETPSPTSLRECGKTQNTIRSLSHAVKTIHRQGMQVMGGFIIGFDNDNETIFQRQIRFIQRTGIVTAMVGVLNALPHTPLWHRLKEEGRLKFQTTGENTDGTINFKPRMEEKKLIEGYQHVLATLYAPKQYYQRIYTFIKSYRPTTQQAVTKTDCLAFLRSIWTIGIKSKARVHYWNLLIKTLATKRKAFPIAVELAIIGLHFQQITEKILSINPDSLANT